MTVFENDFKKRSKIERQKFKTMCYNEVVFFYTWRAYVYIWW